MMKRIFVAFIAVLLFICIPITVSAGTKTAYAVDQPVAISVKAVFKGNTDPNIYKNDVIHGSSSVITENGITVIITGSAEAFEPGVRLVVREITAEEKDARDWFSGVLNGTGTDILPFDIYFEKDGQRIPLNSKVQITITLPDGYEAPFVCYVTTGGKVEALASNVKDDKISFETDHTGYYVLTDKIKDSGGIPQTGDNINLLLYILLMSFTVCLLLFTTRRYKKVKSKIEEKQMNNPLYEKVD